MSDAHAAAAAPDSSRTIAILVYALYLAALINGITAIIGVILAYVKRGEARSTIYESHYTAAIETFWIALGLCLLGAATIWVGIGVLAFLGAFVFWLYRSIKGLVRAIEAKPYA